MKNDNFKWRPMSEWKFIEGDNRKVALRSKVFSDDNNKDGIVVVDANVVALCASAMEWSEISSPGRTVEHRTRILYSWQYSQNGKKWFDTHHSFGKKELRDIEFDNAIKSSSGNIYRKVKITTITHEMMEVEG